MKRVMIVVLLALTASCKAVTIEAVLGCSHKTTQNVGAEFVRILSFVNWRFDARVIEQDDQQATIEIHKHGPMIPPVIVSVIAPYGEEVKADFSPKIGPVLVVTQDAS